MTEQERHAIRKAIENNKYPCSPGNSYDEHFRRVDEPELVPGTPNYKLLDSELYKAGYRKAWAELSTHIEMIMGMTAAEMRKYAGRPKKEKK